MHPTLIPEAEGGVLDQSGARTPLVGGLLLVDKPAGITSHDVVAQVRRAARTKRVGHAGTLDPFATGLLVVAVGHVTRLLPYLDDEPKVYEARFHFGFETDTEDATGQPSMKTALPDWNALPDAIATLTGAIAQRPPSFSAKHVDGERAYKKARRGEVVELAPVIVTVHKWQVRDHSENSLDVTITCGGGTYVRSLARDLGRLLNSAAHCETLRRVQSGRCSVQNATDYSALDRGSIASGTVRLLAPLHALQPMCHVTLTEEDDADIRHGRSIAAMQDGARAALVDSRAHIVAIANRTDDNRWQPRVVLPNDDADES